MRKNISVPALAGLKPSDEILALLDSRADMHIQCRSRYNPNCLWTDGFAESFDDRNNRFFQKRFSKKLTMLDGYASPVNSSEEDFWMRYGFADLKRVNSPERVEWLKQICEDDPRLAKRIKSYLRLARFAAKSESSLVESFIESMVKHQNQFKDNYRFVAGNGKTLGGQTSRKVAVRANVDTVEYLYNAFDFLVPGAIYEEFQAAVRSQKGLSLKPLGEHTVRLVFATKQGAAKFAALEPGRLVYEVKPAKIDYWLSKSASSKLDFHQQRIFQRLPVGSVIDLDQDQVRIPKHFVVSEEFCFGVLKTR